MNSFIKLHKQGSDKPLFENVFWSKPENRLHAGKLLIIGGNLHSVAPISAAAAMAASAGAGQVQILLADALRKLVGNSPDILYAPSTPSGSFAKKGLSEWLEMSNWADMVLLPGELGRNSETTILLETYLQKYTGPVCTSRDSVDLLNSSSVSLFGRQSTVLVATLPQLQKLAKGLITTTPNHNNSLEQYANYLAEISSDRMIISQLHNTVFVAVDGQVSTTPCNTDHWRLSTSVHASIWLMQQPQKAFEALTTATWQASQVAK